MKPEEEKDKQEEQSKEDQMIERLAKYSMGCSGVMMVIITIIVVLLFLYLN
jgi:hypothetical protein